MDRKGWSFFNRCEGGRRKEVEEEEGGKGGGRDNRDMKEFRYVKAVGL